MKPLFVAILTFAFFTCQAMEAFPLHLIDLRVLLSQISSEDTSYEHGVVDVQWKGYKGSKKALCHTDCSGLMDALLSHSYHLNRTDFRRWFGREKALAKDYFRAVIYQNNFSRITQIKDIKTGDFLVIRFLPGAKNQDNDTGHIAIIDEAPQLIESIQPLVKNTHQWVVSVIDCANEPHGIKDSRYIGEKKFYDGLGKGKMRLYTDADGHILGYAWSTRKSTKYFPSTQHPLAIGRIQINPEFVTALP